jgi:hypothetical protein
MSEAVKKIAEMPDNVQLQYQVRAMQHLIVNLITVLREPMAGFVAQKPVIEIRETPREVQLKTTDTVDDFLPSPRQLQEWLGSCAQLPDPLLCEPVHRNAQDAAKELVKTAFGLPWDFVV